MTMISVGDSTEVCSPWAYPDGATRCLDEGGRVVVREGVREVMKELI